MTKKSIRNVLQGGYYMRADKREYPDITPILAQITPLEDYTLEGWYDGGDHWLILVKAVR